MKSGSILVDHSTNSPSLSK